MRLNLLPLMVLIPLAACASAPAPNPGVHVSDVSCVSRFYDYPQRTLPFPLAVEQCSRGRTADLSGSPYYQTLASSFNIPYVSHDAPGTDVITLTGSRIPVPANQPAPPDLSLN